MHLKAAEMAVGEEKKEGPYSRRRVQPTNFLEDRVIVQRPGVKNNWKSI